MNREKSFTSELSQEFKSVFIQPRTFLNTLIINSVVSFIFFLFSYLIGSYNDTLLPIAATTVLLWTLADSSITNQLIFDKIRVNSELKKYGTLKRLLIIKNLNIVILSIPITIVYGLILVSITGKWSDIIYGVLMAIILVWGWLGISNLLSVIIPFEKLSISKSYGNKKVLIKYTLFYILPWIILPIYIVIICLPFIILGWIKNHSTTSHWLASILILFVGSIIIWLIGLFYANSYTLKPNVKIKKMLES